MKLAKKIAIALLFVLPLAAQFGYAEETPVKDANGLIDGFYGLNEQQFVLKTRDLSAKDRALMASKNLAVAMTVCPASHTAQFLAFFAETLPLVSIFAHHPKSPTYTTSEFFGRFLGGPTNAAGDILVQSVKSISHVESADTISKEEVKQAFFDGYQTTIGNEHINDLCYRAERRIELLIGLYNYRIK